MPEADAALTPDDYKQLHAMLLSSDASTRSEGLELAKKLRPDEQQAFFQVQQQTNRTRGPRQDDAMATVGGVDIPPEAVVMGPLQASRALTQSGAIGSRMLAAGSEMWQSAAPILKYEVAKHGLSQLGIPNSLATVLAFAWSGRGAVKSAETEKTLAQAADEAVAAGKLRRAEGWTPESGPLQRPAKPMIVRPTPTESPAPVSATPAAPVTANPPIVTPQVVAQTVAPAKLKLTAAETSEAMKLLRQGKSAEEVIQAIQTQREFLAKFGGVSRQEMLQDVAAKNARTTRAKGGTK